MGSGLDLFKSSTHKGCAFESVEVVAGSKWSPPGARRMKASSSMLLLEQWLRPREAAMARLLGPFVRAESPSFEKAAVDRFGKLVAAEWRRHGAKVTILRQRQRGDHIRVEWNPSRTHAKGQILVLGHLARDEDVVARHFVAAAVDAGFASEPVMSPTR